MILNSRNPRRPPFTMPESTENLRRQIRDFLQYQVSLGFGVLLVPPPQPGATIVSPLEAVRQELGECTRCPLHKTRNTIVFGEGSPRARLMFVGEGPGGDEDREGRPFVGKAGRLLTRMIQAMGLDRSEVYIANIVKCRPPRNRDPEDVEIGTCFPFLEAQISAIRPEVVVALGRVAACTLLDAKSPLSRLRGQMHDRKGVPVMPTYHPSFLLRQGSDRRWKAEAWADLKQVMALLGLPAPGSGD